MVQLYGANGLRITPLEAERWALDDLQKEIGSWVVATFPAATSRSNWEKLLGEVQELGEKLGTPAFEDELADCLIPLLALAHRQGISAAGAIRKKHEINKRRVWGPPDARGVYQHVKETP